MAPTSTTGAQVLDPSRLKLSWTEETETVRHVNYAERRQAGGVVSHVGGADAQAARGAVRRLPHSKSPARAARPQGGGITLARERQERSVFVTATRPVPQAIRRPPPPHSKTRSAVEAVLSFADRVTEAMCHLLT